MVVSPTRELAMQIYNEARKFSNTSVIRAVVAYGGTSVAHQSNMLQVGWGVGRRCHRHASNAYDNLIAMCSFRHSYFNLVRSNV